MVGLEIKISELFSLGKSLVIASIGQIVFTLLGGYVLSLLFGYDYITSVYIATALTFSSTVISALACVSPSLP